MIPPARILVGVDFSESSRAALAFAARLALHGCSRLTVLHVQEPMLTTAAQAAHVDLRADLTCELRRFVHETPPAGQCHPDTFIICGTPGKVICDIAAREQADVVVVGAHGMSGAVRWLFGSNTERVLRGAPMSVVVVPTGWKPPRPDDTTLAGLGPVIAGVDFTEPSYLAASAAARLARFLDTRLALLHVVPEQHVLERWTQSIDRALAEAAARARAHLESEHAHFDAIAPTTVHVITGDIVESLLRAAEPDHSSAPVLVLGRRSEDARESAPGPVITRTLASLRVPLVVARGEPETVPPDRRGWRA